MSSTTPLSASAIPVFSPTARPQPRPALDPARVEACHRGVAEFTRRLFGQPGNLRSETDAEFGNEYFVVEVVPQGNEDEILALWHRWHRELGPAAEELTHLYRLSLLPGE